MAGSTIDDFRTIHVSLTDVNQFIPPIITSAGDSHGRRLAVTLSSNGRPVALTNLTANLLYNPQDGTFGDMAPMSKDGDTFYADIPAGALTDKDITRMAIAVSDTGHTVVTREFELMIERGALNTAGEDGGAGLLQTALDRASTQAERAEFAASNANGSAQAAESGANAAKYQAEQAAEAAKSAAESKQAAATSESNARIAYEQSLNLSEQSTKSAKAAKQSEDNAKQSEDAAVKAAQSVQSAQEKIATIQQEVDNKISNFTVTANAESVESDEAASVTVTRDGAAYNLAFNIPQGAKGDKGDKGDAGAGGMRLFFTSSVTRYLNDTYTPYMFGLMPRDTATENASNARDWIHVGDIVICIGKGENLGMAYRVTSFEGNKPLMTGSVNIFAQLARKSSQLAENTKRSEQGGTLTLTPISEQKAILTIEDYVTPSSPYAAFYTVPTQFSNYYEILGIDGNATGSVTPALGNGDRQIEFSLDRSALTANLPTPNVGTSYTVRATLMVKIMSLMERIVA